MLFVATYVATLVLSSKFIMQRGLHCTWPELHKMSRDAWNHKMSRDARNQTAYGVPLQTSLAGTDLGAVPITTTHGLHYELRFSIGQSGRLPRFSLHAAPSMAYVAARFLHIPIRLRIGRHTHTRVPCPNVQRTVRNTDCRSTSTNLARRPTSSTSCRTIHDSRTSALSPHLPLLRFRNFPSALPRAHGALRFFDVAAVTS